MAQNKVQYQRGMSMPEFFDRYGPPEQCESLVRAWCWPEGFACPRCKGGGHSEFRRQDRLYFQCSSCRYQCSLVSGTVFESSKLPLPTWFLAMHLMTQAKNNVSALELNRHLGVSYPTAWLLKHKIMQVMVSREQWRQLTGRVEIPLSQTSCRFSDLHGSTTNHEPKPTLQRIPRPSAEQGQTARHA